MSTIAAETPQATRPRAEVPEISILIHVTDPAAPIEVLVRTYGEVLQDIGRRGELVFILDGVAGDLLEKLEQLQAQRGDVRVLALQGGGHGESIAFKAALEHARGQYLLTTWDYLQVDPRELASLMRARDENDLDLVTSWRWPRVDPFLNRIQSSFFNWFLRWLSRVNLHDLNCNFRLMRREVLEEVTIYGDLFRFLPIMASRRGFRVQEVKVRHLEERGKTGFFGLGVYLRRLLDILAVTFLTRFTRKPLRFFGSIGIVLVVLGLTFALPPFVERVLGVAGIQDRPIVLLGVVLISFGLQFIGFGLIGEIIIFTQSRNLKDYKIERILAADSGAPAALPSQLGNVIAELAPARGDEVVVRRPSPGEDIVLDRYTARHPQGTVFHLSGWRRMVEEVCDREAELLVAERGSEIVGFLPSFHLESVFLGRIAVSMPFAVYGGCLAADADVARRLIAEAADRSDQRGNAYLELRQVDPWEPDGLKLESNDRYVTFWRDLPQDPEECLGIIPRKARAEARRGRDGGLRFEERLDLKLFRRLFAINKQALGSPAIPMSMLRSIHRNLGERVVMHQVSLPDGKCIAMVLSFRFRDRILPYYSGAVLGVENLGTNNFMYWKLMEWAVQQGIRLFDFGRSRRDSGPAHFKKNMGFQPKPLHYQYHLGEGGRVPEFTPDNPKLTVYKRLWRAIPRPIASAVGAQIFKQLP